MSCGSKLKRKINEVTGKVDSVVKEYAGYALSISTNIKNILDSPLGDLVTQIIPGTWDDELREKATDALVKTVDVLALTSDIANTKDLNQKLRMFVAGLADKSPEFKQSQLKKIADLVTAYLDNNKLASHMYEATTLATLLVETKPAPEVETHED